MYRYYLYHPVLKQPVRVKNEPVGWDSLNKKLLRDPKTHGIFTSYTPKLKFIRDGRALIHTLYEKYGPEAEIILFIDIFNPVTRKFERDYTGRLNLMTLTLSTLYAECNIENTGFVMKFKNRQDVKVNVGSLVDLDGKAITAFAGETVNVLLHSKTIKRTFNAEATIDTFTYADIQNPENLRGFVIGGLEATNDEISERFSFATQVIFTSPEETGRYLFLIKEGGSYTFDIFASARVATTMPTGSLTSWSFTYIFKYGKPGNYTTVVIASVSDTIDEDLILQASYDATINLNAGDEVYFYGYFDIDLASDGVDVSFQPYAFPGPSFGKTSISIVADTSVPATNANMYLAHEAISRICQSILGVEDPVRSDYYGRVDSAPHAYAADGPGSLRGFLPGFWVRGFPVEEKPLNMSLKDLLQTLTTIDGVGIGIETIDGKQYVVVKDLSHFYADTELMRLDYVRDIEKEVAEDRYYSEYEIGYDKWTITGGEINHLDEFNTKREGTFPITQTKNKLRLISPYIAGGYPLESTRRDSYTTSNTKDNENDNEVFIVQLKRNGFTYETARDEDYDSIDNVIDPETIYNADLSPMRCLRRNGRIISSFLQKHLDADVRLNFSKGNSAMQSKRTDEADTVDEGANIPVSSLRKPLWLPELYRFKAPLTQDQIVAMNTTPHGYVSFSDTDKGHKKCFILEAERDAKTRLVSFVGLRANL